MNRHAPASEIMIEDFRQILAWPFVMSSDQGNGATGSEENWFEERGKELESQDSHWNKKSPRELMKDGSISAYEEENVFHEYINDTLFRDNPAIRSFQYESLRKITFQFRRNREGVRSPTISRSRSVPCRSTTAASRCLRSNSNTSDLVSLSTRRNS